MRKNSATCGTCWRRCRSIEPSFGFDARVRQRVAAEPRARWFAWFVPQPRLAFSVALLLALSVWVARLPHRGSAAVPTTAANESEQFQEIKDLGVLENYEVLTKFDALSELTPAAAAVRRPRPNVAKQTIEMERHRSEEFGRLTSRGCAPAPDGAGGAACLGAVANVPEIAVRG